MDKKFIPLIVAILILVVAGLTYFGLHRKSPSYSDNPILTSNNGKDYPSAMKGHVVTSTADSVTVQGIVMAQDQTDKKQVEKTVKFAVNSRTFYKKTQITIPYGSGPKSKVTPQVKAMMGSISDLVANTDISNILTDTNLFEANSAVASEISYSIVVTASK